MNHVSSRLRISCPAETVRIGRVADNICTCVLGHRDHSEDCACTTPVMDCAVHGDSQIGLDERAVVEAYYAAHPELA